jgi:hypothetical protein
MCWLGKHELTPRHDQNAINVYNKIHVGYKVKVEWGIGRLKYKWRQLMKHFDFTKSKYNHLFCAILILTNFLHKCRMDFTYEIIDNQIENLAYYN